MERDIRQRLSDIQAATDRVLATTAALTDAAAGGASLLPGWTRGHVLTHIARNADGLRNLLIWARTGTETPMYASRGARGADIDAGAGRPAGELAADVRGSAAAFAAEAAGQPAGAWTAQVRALTGPPFPAREVLARRLSEVEIHHLDLAAGYGPRDWPDDFVADNLPRVAESFRDRDDAPVCVAWPDGATHGFRLGAEPLPAKPLLVTGPARDMLTWLLGRDGGSGLRTAEGGPVPALPDWR